jgi:hypothetical protein
MKTRAKTLLYSFKWIPRIICILFAAFISLFALDSFGPGISFWKALPGFLIHMIPTFLIVIVLIFSWKWEWVGGMFFLLLAIAYLIWSSKSGNGSHLIDIPLFIISMLFFTSWFMRKNTGLAEADDEGT